MSNIKPGGVLSNLDKFTILDVRTIEEFNNFNIPKSINIPIDTLEENISKIPLNKPIVCICRSGNRSENATYVLNSKGIESRNLEGGILSWVKSELDKKLITNLEYRQRVKKINI